MRDIARAHVRALDSPPTSEVGRKRIIIASPYDFSPADVVKYVSKKRPELGDRIVKPESAPKYRGYKFPLDFDRIEQVLGMKTSDFHVSEETALNTVDSLLEKETEWRNKGFEVVIPK